MNMPILPQTIQVADKQTSLIQYKSVPVMTTEQMADFYETEIIRVQQNFIRNALRFIDGKHYFKVEGEDLRNLKNTLTSSKIVSPNARSLILWTEKGAARHAKILDTDQAWDVFEQLEEVYFAVKEKTHLPALPNFADPAEAAIAWANEYKAKQLAITERDHAIATKAEIGSRREATAMGRLSAKVKEVEKLKTQLDSSTSFATIKKVQSITGGTYDTYALRRHSKAQGLEIQKAEDANYGSVNSYHKDAWLAVYNINLSNLNGAA
ncbi:ORF6N domain-containing protein [Acinetobacter sp. YH12245]|uniref:ORF6N domain-containing protein n=1 Tax=Acinetobacter sp. YH12245 TaxID=2601171 RepID=UPI00211DB72A|nr:ORF6N domain-containing protein [Acinetobacter sp. YH12245]